MKNTAIADVGETLVSLLRKEITAANRLNEVVGVDEKDIVLLPPDAHERHANIRLSLFPYAVIESPYLKNEPLKPMNAASLQLPPLSLDVYFLLSAHIATGGDSDAEMKNALASDRLLGRAMQIFYDNGVISGSKLKGNLAGEDLELRVTLNPVTVEDLTRIWSVFPNLPFRMSICYAVTPVQIESGRSQQVSRVADKTVGQDEMVENPETI